MYFTCFNDVQEISQDDQDRKLSELRKIVFKEYNFNISALVGLFVWIVY
jgi:hypothetical protein